MTFTSCKDVQYKCVEKVRAVQMKFKKENSTKNSTHKFNHAEA